MKDYLLDTHGLLWFLGKDKQLSQYAFEIIQSSEKQVYISIASFWEVAIKSSLGKFDFNADIEEIMDRSEELGFIQLDIQSDHLKTLSSLPHHHKDPFDRLIIAQALSHDLTILSADRHFPLYENVKVAWDK